MAITCTLFILFFVCINLRICIVFGYGSTNKHCVCRRTNAVCCCSLSITENVVILCNNNMRVEILNAVNYQSSMTTCYHLPTRGNFSNVIEATCSNDSCFIHSRDCTHCTTPGRPLRYIKITFRCYGLRPTTVPTVKSIKMTTSNRIHRPDVKNKTAGLTSSQRVSKTSTGKIVPKTSTFVQISSPALKTSTIKIELSTRQTSYSVWKTSQVSIISTDKIELSTSQTSYSVQRSSQGGIIAGSICGFALLVVLILLIVGRKRRHCCKSCKDVIKTPPATRSNPVYDFQPEIVQPNAVQITNIGEIAKHVPRKNKCSYENTASFDQTFNTRQKQNQECPYNITVSYFKKDDEAYDHIRNAKSSKTCSLIDVTYDRTNDCSDINSEFNVYDHTVSSQIRTDTDETYDHTFGPTTEDDYDVTVGFKTCKKN